MNMPVAILAGLSLVALAIYSGNTPAFSQSEVDAEEIAGFGPWNFKGFKDDTVIWKINSRTGAMNACFMNIEKREAFCAEVK
jgi:hypothetical protein